MLPGVSLAANPAVSGAVHAMVVMHRVSKAAEGRPGYKPEARVTPEEVLAIAKEKLDQVLSMAKEKLDQINNGTDELFMDECERLSRINNGTDDLFIDECERLSRVREDRLNTLLGKTGGTTVKGLNTLLGQTGGTTVKGSNRTNIETQRRNICDDFETKRGQFQDGLRRETKRGQFQDGLRREQEEIQAKAQAELAAAPDKMRARRKTAELAAAPDKMRARRKVRLARGEGDDLARGPNTMINRLNDVQQRVVLQRDLLERDLECLRAKDPSRPKVLPPPLPMGKESPA
ncbi:hypothetical protein T484DRAFT_1886716, partial [Baffinella frigidus]